MAPSDDLALITTQEKELVFQQFDHEIAWDFGRRLRSFAVDRKLPVVIDVRRFGHPLFYAALHGTTPDNSEWIRRKSNTVARFLRSSYAIGLKLQIQQITLLEKYSISPSDYSVHGGSFPITVAGAGVIGSITVSGLPQREDHELVIEVLCSELNKDYAKLQLPKD